jgi:predicted transcriptional regulator
MVSDDINQVPVVQGGDSRAEVLGIIGRDSILRVIQAHLELQSSSLNHATRP